MCAKGGEHVNDGGRVTIAAWILLFILLLLPAGASVRLPLAPWIIPGYALFISLVTYAFYFHDKKQARAKQWRTSESTLHFLELIGGWPGALLAQRQLRHKCSKLGYQFIFWLIVLAYQFVAIDFLFDWKLSKAVRSQTDRTLSR